jgi:large subunit ribosomal protein L29
MTKAKDLRDQSLEELEANYDECCKKLFDLKNQAKAEKKFDKPHEMKHLRKEIARLLTVMAEKSHQSLAQSS